MEGYDAKFDPPLEKRLECPICLLAQREPMQTPCGHRFCSACILRALRETGPRCPVDNTTVCVHQLFKDNYAKREVLSLNVHCSADLCGCTWQGELRDLQVHNKQCELVLMDCPNSCGHSCRRSELQGHIPNCSNRPTRCSTCSVSFPRSSLSDHQPHCSHVSLPSSVTASVDKAGEVLKWVGHLRLKLNGTATQVTGYLTAVADSEESYLSTGCWCSNISLITLNSLASHIFSRMLTSSEVQPVVLNFSLLTSDAKSLAFQKIFRRKPEVCNAAVCLRLKPGNRRAMRELTIMYLCWCDQRKKLQAYIANLKTHLVRQIQTHLHEIQNSRRQRRMRGGLPSNPSRHHTPSSSASSSSSSQSQSQSHVLAGNHNNTMTPQGPGSHLHSHSRPHVHHLYQHQPPLRPGMPTAQMFNIQPLPPPLPPHNDIQGVVQQQPPPPMQHHVVAAAATGGNAPAILPNLLSWQMSQSFNTYPWRMQATGVPFFTFPSTPPSYIPANSYPYTFAPLPAAPFSISPMQPVPTTVHMPSYNGLSVVVPPGSTVDTTTVPPPHHHASRVVQHGFPVVPPAAAAAVVPSHSQPGLDREVQAVAVTLNGDVAAPILHVLQQRSGGQDHQIRQYHHHHHHHQGVGAVAPMNIATATAPPALIATHPPPPPPTSQANTAAAASNVTPVVPFEFLSAGDIPSSGHHAQAVHQNVAGAVSAPPPPFAFEVVSIPTRENRPLQNRESVTPTPFVFDAFSSHTVHMSESDRLHGTATGSNNHRSLFPVDAARHSSQQSSRSSHIQSTGIIGSYPRLLPGGGGAIWDEIPGPSGLNRGQSFPESSSSRDSTPDVPSFPMFSPDDSSDDSDISVTPDLLTVSPAAAGLFDESVSGLSSSDQDDSSADDTPHDMSMDSSSSSSTTSALHTLADAAAILADSPSTPVSSSSSSSSAAASGASISTESSSVGPPPPPLRLPVLINISDSESDSRLSPSAIIDLTNSPTSSARHSARHSATAPPLSRGGDPFNNYGVIVSSTNGARHGGGGGGVGGVPSQPLPATLSRQQQESATIPPPPVQHSDGHISAVLVPVIHHWNGPAEHHHPAALHPIQPYIPTDPAIVHQAAAAAAAAAQVGVEEAVVARRIVHPAAAAASRVSEAPLVVAAVQLQQPPGYPVQEYPNRVGPALPPPTAALASWPAEIPPPGHPVQHALLYTTPHQQQAVSNQPRGDFWDTVIPSLDMTLQSSANAES